MNQTSAPSIDLTRLDSFLEKSLREIATTDSIEEIENFYQDFLSKKGTVSLLMREIKNLSVEEKKETAPKIQKIKKELMDAFLAKQELITNSSLNAELAQDWIDISKEGNLDRGSLHPISHIQHKVEKIFQSIGFEICSGTEVETEWYNFDALNIPSTHPARDMQDTFFINQEASKTTESCVMRTHTSSVQIHRMQTGELPIKMICPGRVFRNEDIDATHDATFYQFEGLVVGEDISMAHLRGVLEEFLEALFEKKTKIRMRPSYFPFVEPGMEIDMWFEAPGKEPKWMEIMGSGMVHPEVLKNAGIDPDKHSGFAFGFGLTRLAMIYYKVDDIRLLSSPKIDFLRQF